MTPAAHPAILCFWTNRRKWGNMFSVDWTAWVTVLAAVPVGYLVLEARATKQRVKAIAEMNRKIVDKLDRAVFK